MEYFAFTLTTIFMIALDEVDIFTSNVFGLLLES